MTINSFIFSERKKDRVVRHILFWVIWGFYFGLLHAANPLLPPQASYFRRLEYTLAESVLLLIPQALLAYMILFIAMPIYMRHKNLVGALVWTAISWFACGFLNHYMVLEFNRPFLLWLLPDFLTRDTQRPESVMWFIGLMSTWKGAFSATAFVLGFHYIKQWYLKEQRNLQLMQENTQAQLQLLTAQVHPHFLFNTLNNIYSQAQQESPNSAKMIIGLSDLLRYVLYKGRQDLVPLEEELEMMLKYIRLEKMRYGNDLDLHYELTENTQDLLIAPLLLLPFLENCFKHGASNMLSNAWINLTVDRKGDTMIMKLMNGKPAQPLKNAATGGIGIDNVRKRLQLLYAGRHELSIRDEQEVFIVNLKVALQPIQSVVRPETNLDISYA